MNGALRTRRVDHVDGMILPCAKRRCRLYGDPLLSFQFHAVHSSADSILASDLHPTSRPCMFHIADGYTSCREGMRAKW